MRLKLLVTLIAVTFLTGQVFALTIPSDGSDGDFNPTNDIVVDLSLASTGTWDSSNASNAGRGIYDSSKWAVVFKYASVNIPAGVTVKFINHPTYAPVVWLISGNVTINGVVSVQGSESAPDAIGKLVPAEPGPGGFRGGPAGPSGLGAGYGPGSEDSGFYGRRYGNPQIIPLIGGSGAGANYYQSDGTSGGGGGAILIMSSGNIHVDGVINADGGNNTGFWAGGGSGGAVRIVANLLTGSGEIRALNPRNVDGHGRIRVETSAIATTMRISPQTIAVSPAAIPIIWPADDAPAVRLYSVDGQLAPLDPTAALASSADVSIQQNGTVQVLLETKNFPPSGMVQLRTVQKYGEAAWVTATHLSGNFASSTWVVNVTFAPGFTTLQARATVP